MDEVYSRQLLCQLLAGPNYLTMTFAGLFGLSQFTEIKILEAFVNWVRTYLCCLSAQNGPLPAPIGAKYAAARPPVLHGTLRPTKEERYHEIPRLLTWADFFIKIMAPSY